MGSLGLVFPPQVFPLLQGPQVKPPPPSCSSCLSYGWPLVLVTNLPPPRASRTPLCANSPKKKEKGTSDRASQAPTANLCELNDEASQIAIEICCGHAGLTAALWDAGFEATGIDWGGNRHRPTVPIIRADLTTPEGQNLVWKLSEDKKTAYVHMGPPCGTFTRARENPSRSVETGIGSSCAQTVEKHRGTGRNPVQHFLQ